MPTPVEAHLADGTILQFPEGTDPAIVQLTVKRHIATTSLNAGVPSKPPAGSTSAGNDPTNPSGFVDAASSTVDAARPFSIPAAISAGIKTADITPGPPTLKALAGAGMAAGTYVGADTALQKIRNLLSGSSEEPDLADSAKNLAINEIGGKVIGAAARGANAATGGRLGQLAGSAAKTIGINSSLTPDQEEMSKLSPTFAQYFGNKKIPKTLEDLFAAGTKTASIKNSGKLADSMLTSEAQDVSGRAVSVVNSPQQLASRIQVNDLSNAAESTYAQSKTQGELARVIAKGNVVQIPGNLADAPEVDQIARSQAGSPYDKLNPQQQQAVLQIAQKMGIQPPLKPPVEGPIHLKSTLEDANEIYNSTQNLLYGLPEEKKDLANQAFKLIRSTNAKFDPQTGQLISADPGSFGETWDLKQELDKQSGWGKSRNDLTQSERGFRQMSAKMIDDMEASIAKWSNGSKQAQQAFANAKEAVAKRNALFYTEGSNNKFGNIIEDVDSPIDAVNSILKDPNQLQRALNTGKFTLGQGSGKTIVSTNMRGDLQAYNLIKLRDGAKALDATDQTGGLTFDGQKMYNDWLDPRSPRNNTNLYSNQQKQDYDQLFKNIAMTQQKGSTIGSYLTKVYLARGVLSAAPVLLGLSSHMSAAGELAAVELGAMGVAKLMAKPDTARILVAAAGGQPLSMSEQMAARKLTAGLQGVTIALMGKDGKKTEGSFDNNGEFKPLDQPSQ